MIKKLLILFLPLALNCASYASVTAPQPDPVATEMTVGDQIVAEPAMPPSEAVNYVEESELARKMQQAKKAEDAKKYDSYGGGITIISMCIVIGALIVLSVLFYIFGNISSWFLSHKKKQVVKEKGGNNPTETADTSHETGELIAAISAALASHFAIDHDMEDTILTIKKLRKAYSPWNSKIYNMRHLPEVNHNHPKNPLQKL